MVCGVLVIINDDRPVLKSRVSTGAAGGEHCNAGKLPPRNRLVKTRWGQNEKSSVSFMRLRRTV